MLRPTHFLFLAFCARALLLAAPDDTKVFRSDVSLVRVDAQVVDRDNRAITGLRAEDFVLREEGRPQEIRNFESEDMPVDLLFLLDVSASMRPHVERIASAAHQALRGLGEKDRIGIMVFDRSTRIRLPFRNSRADVEREFERLLRQEHFNGGTDITRGLLDAANYIGREGRREARRAIVILTDDQTELDRDEEAVSRALVRADAVLSALIAPDAVGNRGGYPGSGGSRRGGYPSGGGWPGSTWPGGGMGGPLGGIILGPRGGNGGRYPGSGPRTMGSRTHSAGTEEIARQSGGDSMPVDDAAALETTLDRIRQRYALHFHLPSDARSGQQRRVSVQLADSARRRYPDAEVRFRREYVVAGGLSGTASGDPAPVEVTRVPASVASSEDQVSEVPRLRRKAAVNEDDGPRGANPSVGAAGAAAQSEEKTAPAQNGQTGGWRRVKPGEKP